MQKGQAQAKLALADQDTPSIHIYDARGGSSEPMDSVQPHRAPVLAMRFNAHHDTVISLDSKGRAQSCKHCVKSTSCKFACQASAFVTLLPRFQHVKPFICFFAMHALDVVRDLSQSCG